MKKLIKVAMTLTLMAMVINVASAQQGPRKGAKLAAGYHQGMMMAGLNLTEDQQTQMRSMHLQMQKETLPIQNKIGENRAKIRTLSTVDNVDLKIINKLIDENSDLMAKIMKIRMANHQNIRKILTDEQRIIFDNKGFDRGGNSGSCAMGHGRQMGYGTKGHRPGGQNQGKNRMQNK